MVLSALGAWSSRSGNNRLSVWDILGRGFVSPRCPTFILSHFAFEEVPGCGKFDQR
jgi:hypothetical protein